MYKFLGGFVEFMGFRLVAICSSNLVVAKQRIPRRKEHVKIKGNMTNKGNAKIKHISRAPLSISLEFTPTYTQIMLPNRSSLDRTWQLNCH